MKIVILLFSLCIFQCNGDNFFGNTDTKENWIARLYKDKLQNYNKASRPILDPSHNTTVHLGMALNKVNVDDHAQTLSVNAWSIMSWRDEHLRWDPKEYMNIDRMHFDEQDIWVPDIKVFNTDETSNVHPFGEVPILVDNDGRTYWFPPTHIRVPCDLDLSLWPSDEHECVIRMGSWTHRGEQLDTQLLEHNGTAVSLDVYEKNNRWELLKVEGKRQEITLSDEDTYYEIDFHFTLKRRARTQAIYITQSTLAMVVVVLASYCLPLRLYYTRIVMHLISLAVLIGCFFTLFVTLPANGGPVPLIVRYYSGTIVLTSISLLSTILLTTQACCFSSSSYSSSSKRLVGIVASTPGLRNVIHANYNQLDSELGEELEETRTQPSTSQQSSTATEDSQNSITAHNIRRIINFLLFLLFTIAFCVDYTVLRSVA